MFGLGNDHAATRLYLLLGCPLYVAGCIGIWPLGSMEPDATDPKYYQPITYPTKDDCFEQGPGKFKDQNCYHDVLKFTGKRRSYVDIKLTDPDSNKPQNKIGIAFTLYADILSDGTFFHYRAEINHTDKINEVEVKLTTGGGINIRYWHCLSGTCYTEDKDIPEVLTTETWYEVSLLREANGKLKWKAGTDVGAQQDETGENFFLRDIPWNLNGDVRIGGRLDNPIGGFVGKLWCVGIMPNGNNPKCAIPSGSDKRPCNNVTIKFIWPLNDKSKGYEVIQRIHPVSPPSHGMNFQTSEPIKGSLTMSTYSVQSQFKTRIHHDGEMGTRLAVALFVKPENMKNTWTIINVRPSEGYYLELTVIQESATIKAILKSKNGDVEISLKQILTTSTWYFVAAQINWFWDELSLIVDDKFDSVKLNLIHSYQNTYKYLVNIEIGNDPPPKGRPPKSPGQVACVAIFNAPLEETSAAIILEKECNERKGYTAPVENGTKPIRIWPLGKRSYGYEVIEPTSMADPPDLCWRFSDQNAADPIDSEAVRFYGYDRFSLKIASTVSNLNSLTIGLFLKPEINISGTIIDVKFKSGLTTYTLSVALNQMNISLKLEEVGASCSKLSDPVVIGEEVWTAVVIQSVSTSDFQLFLSDSTKIQLNTQCTTVISPFTVSEIHVGKSADLNPTTGFRGSMRCLAMFNESLLEAQATDILRNGCDSANIVSRPGPVTSTTPILATAVWKLDNDPANGKRKSDMSKLESNTSLVFDGSSLLHVLVVINLTANMSLGLFIRPSRHPKGTILKSTSLPQLEVSIKKTTVYVSFNNSNTKCSTLEFHGVQPLYWHLLVIRRVPDCNSLVVTLNDEVQTTLGDCFTVDPNTVVPVRLGGESQSFNNFRGEMSCLAVFDQALPIDKTEAAMVRSCNEKSSGNIVEVEEDGYDTPPNFMTSKYRQIQSNAAPLDTTGTLATRVAKSLSHCTKLCNQQPYCRSFTLNKSSAECTLFNFITLDGLTSKADVNYYAVLFTQFSVVK